MNYVTRFLPLTFGFSPCLPVSVCGTGTCNLARGFSWQCEVRSFGTIVPSPSQLEIVERIFLFNSLTAWTHSSILPHSLSSFVIPSLIRLLVSIGLYIF